MNDITRSATTKALLDIVPPILGAISAAAQTTAGFQSVARYLDLAQGLIATGSAAYQQLVALKATIQQMVKENRNPTPQEWDALEGRSAVAHRSIQDYDVDAEAEREEDAHSEPAQGESASE